MLELFTLLFCFFGADRKNFCVCYCLFPWKSQNFGTQMEPSNCQYTVSNCQLSEGAEFGLHRLLCADALEGTDGGHQE